MPHAMATPKTRVATFSSCRRKWEQTSGRVPHAPSSQADQELLDLRFGLPFGAISQTNLQAAASPAFSQKTR